MVEQLPASNERGAHCPRVLDTVQVDAATYEAGRQAIADGLIPGWRLVWPRSVDAA
jgi:hypothetical protein